MLVGPMEGHENDVRCVVYTPDAQHLVTASDDGTIRVWDVITGEQVGEPMRSHTNIITSIAISPDGTFLATAGPNTVMQVWNLTTRDVAGPTLRHANDVSCVAFSFDGRYIAGGCCDFRVWLWDASLLWRYQSSPSAGEMPPAQQPSLSLGAPTPRTPVLPEVPLPPEHEAPQEDRQSPAMVPLPPSPLSSIAVPSSSRTYRERDKRRSPDDSVRLSSPSDRTQVGHPDSLPSSPLEDTDEVLFLCCYFARTKRRE
ncbi:hypothetical protein ID866_8754 [Astraeus odoratus]|nr:hypothetical protein ID866_8754 [Astraeus odoratus]